MTKSIRIPMLLTLAETAERLGCHSKTVQRLIARGELRAHRVSQRLVRIAEDDLMAYVATRRG